MKLRKFELKQTDGAPYSELLDVIMSGGSTSDEIVKAVSIGARAEEAKDGVLWLSQEEHSFLLKRLNATTWNSTPANRKTIAEFIAYLRELKEEAVEVKGANA
jgi:hypothetical protein